MTRVALSVPIAEGVALQIDRELDRLHLMIGRWVVELIGGKLCVRPGGAAVNEGLDVLRVEA